MAFLNPENAANFRVTCISSSKLPLCKPSGSEDLCSLINAVTVQTPEQLQSCACLINIVKEPTTGKCIVVEGSIETFKFPEICGWCRYRLPNDLAYTLDASTTGFFPLTWSMPSLVVNGTEHITTPLISNITVPTQTDIRGFQADPSNTEAGGVVQELEAINDFFRRAGLLNVIRAVTITGAKYIPMDNSINSSAPNTLIFTAGFVIEFNPCVVTWFRFSIERIWVNEPANDTYTYQFNDPAPPIGASTAWIVNGASVLGYGGNENECYVPTGLLK